MCKVRWSRVEVVETDAGDIDGAGLGAALRRAEPSFIARKNEHDGNVKLIFIRVKASHSVYIYSNVMKRKDQLTPLLCWSCCLSKSALAHPESVAQLH